MLHIGGDVNIPMKDIIMIMDVATARSTAQNANYLDAAKRKGWFVLVSEEECKSYVITERKGRRRVFLSPISSTTLLKRSRARKRMSL